MLTPKTLHYALLALSLAVINRQSIKNPKVVISLLRNGVTQLKELLQQGNKQHLYTIICCLTALTILNDDLTLDDLDVLYNGLSEIDPSTNNLYPQNLYQPSKLKKTEELSYWQRIFDPAFAPTNYLSLKAIKKQAVQKKQVYASWVAKTIDHAKTRDVKNAIKTLHILRHTIENGQRQFEFKESNSTQAALKVLQNGLSDNERKIKQSAIIALSELLINEGIPQEFRDALQQAQEQQRSYALIALIRLIERRPDVLRNSPRWLPLLKKLSESEYSSLRYKANYLYNVMIGNLEQLVDNLLIHDCCVEATMALLKIVQSGKELENGVLIQIDELLNAKSNSKYFFPAEARYNAIIALSHTLQQQKKIPEKLITTLLNLLAGTQIEKDLIPATQAALGYHISINPDFQIPASVLSKVGDHLQQKTLCLSASFLLAEVMHHLSPATDLVLVSKLVKSMISVLGVNNFDVESRRNCSLALLRLQAIGKDFSNILVSELNLLACTLQESSDLEIKRRIISLVGFIIQDAEEINISTALINSVISVVKNHTDSLQYDAREILITYARKSKKLFDKNAIDNIAGLLKCKETRELALDILLAHAQASANHFNPIHSFNFSEYALLQISEILVDDAFLLRLKAINILHTLAIHCVFSKSVTKNIISSLEGQEIQIINYAVGCLQIMLSRPVMAAQWDAEDWLKLTDSIKPILANDCISLQTRINATSILAKMSEHRVALDSEVLQVCGSLLNSESDELREQAVKVFELQMPRLQLSILAQDKTVQQLLNQLAIGLMHKNTAFSTLRAFKKAQHYGYRIPDTLIAQLVDHLMQCPAPGIRSLAFEILNYELSHSACALSVEQQHIVWAEAIAVSISTEVKPDAAIEKIKNLQNLVQLEERQLPLSCLAVAQQQLAEGKYTLEWFNLCLSLVKNGQALPKSLVQVISAAFCNIAPSTIAQTPVNNVDSAFFQELRNVREKLWKKLNPIITKPAPVLLQVNAAEIYNVGGELITLLVQQGEFIEAEFFQYAEQLLIHSHSTVPWLMLLNISVSRGTPLSEKCLTSLVAIMLDTADLQIRQNVAETICRVIVKQASLSPAWVNYLVEGLLVISEDNNDGIKSKITQVLIERQDLLDCIAEKQIKLLCSGLLAIQDVEKEKLLIDSLERYTAQHNANLSAEENQLIAFKKQEHIILSPSVSIAEKLSVINQLGVSALNSSRVVKEITSILYLLIDNRKSIATQDNNPTSLSEKSKNTEEIKIIIKHIFKISRF